jgi:hypothetical protein
VLLAQEPGDRRRLYELGPIADDRCDAQMSRGLWGARFQSL